MTDEFTPAPLEGPRDVFTRLVDEAEHSFELGLMAFALIENKRFDWMRHVEKYENRTPDQSEIDRWHRELPPSELRIAVDHAESMLRNSAETIMGEVLDLEVRRVRDSTLFTEIQTLRRFWPAFGVNVAGGLTSALVFAALVVLLGAYVLADFDLIKVFSEQPK
jgi:hypothetical protein